jgi:putative hydrolase of the HAD superfamily
MPLFRACIFDLFGTLVPTTLAGNYTGSLREMARTLGLPEGDLLREWHATYAERNQGRLPTLEANVREVCRRLGLTPPEEVVALSLEAFRRMTIEALRPKAESEEVLATLRLRGYRLGLISNCNPEVPRLFRQGPLSLYFDRMMFSSEVGRMKPEPSLYREMAQRLGVAPMECLYVGDGHERELAGASGVGMTTVLVAYNLPDGFVWGRDERGDHSVADLREVLALLPAMSPGG